MRGSTIRSSKLKPRLYAAGLKARKCELCGQGELWNGTQISLILDHANGDHADNRLENLRIVCPNCNAGLGTHCGRNARVQREERSCARCGLRFAPKRESQRYCSRACGSRHTNRERSASRNRTSIPVPAEELATEVTVVGYRQVARRFAVSDVTIRNWLRRAGIDPPPGGGRRPPRRANLTDEQAAEALRLLGQGVAAVEVATRFGVTRWCMDDLRAGRTYRHVARPTGITDRARLRFAP